MTADLRRRLLLLAAALFTLWAMWQVREVDETPSSTTPARRAGIAPSIASALPEPGAAMSLPARVKLTDPVRDLFQLPTPIAQPASTKDDVPKAPPLPFGYLGGISDAGGAQVFLFLSEGSRTLVAKPGTRLAGGWVLEKIEPGQLVFNYEALQQRQHLVTGGSR
jgi:hypothetical protein